MDTVRPIANYSALRSYTGRAKAVRITDSVFAGLFILDAADTTTADNGGTVIVGGSGRQRFGPVRRHAGNHSGESSIPSRWRGGDD